MREEVPGTSDRTQQLRRVMGFWDVLLFRIADCAGAAMDWWRRRATGQSSVSLWILVRRCYFCSRTAYIVVELSTRFRKEGGLGKVRDKDGVRRFSWIRCRMDLLDLYRFLFSRIADCQRGHGRLRGWRAKCMDGAESLIFAGRIAGAAGGGRVAEYHRAAYWKMAAKRGRRGDVSSADDDRVCGAAVVGAARIGNSFFLVGDDAALGLGHGEFLAAAGVRLRRAGTGFGNERGSEDSATHISGRNFRVGRADRADVYRGDRGRVDDAAE